MSLKKYGSIKLDKDSDKWVITELEPHVSIRLKNVFLKIAKGTGLPYHFLNNPENSADLTWFMSRYPLKISWEDLTKLGENEEDFYSNQIGMERILTPNYKPKPYSLKEGQSLRYYQSQAVEIWKLGKSLLVGDDVGLGKTYEAIGGLVDQKLRPALVVVMTHLQEQWAEKIDAFSHLTTHIIKGTKPYNLSSKDVYIIRYSCLAGWVPIFQTGFFKSVVFDEIQELRVWNESKPSQKVLAAKVLTDNTEYNLGLSASPIYNYGDEIFNVLDVLKSGCLGSRIDFLREWTNGSYGSKPIVKDTKALGSHLRENHLLLRRTREDVGQYLPPVNVIIHKVDFDEAAVKKTEDIARILAIKVTTGSFVERGQAARELDMMVRKTTGVSKAKYVAEFVKMMLENGEPVVLAGWHRDVYSTWLEELKDYNPVMYTGSESAVQKRKSVKAFVNKETDLFIISLRSGVGLDELQHRASIVVIGELDWSPKVHEQLIGRVDREGQKDHVTVFYLVSDSGSDPLIIDLLGIKASQSKGIMDPFMGASKQHSDMSRITLLAEKYLNNNKST
ncbi:DEAD/DEAH box helicase [bacterium]|nr:DEAD/DEAH box helicase [bacterium]